MKVVRFSGAAVIAALALAVLAPAGALGAMPEAGQCTEVAAGTGEYANNSCTRRAGPTTKPGNWNWKAFAASDDMEFGGGSGEVKLITSGHPTIKCKSSSWLGRFTGAKTASVKAALRECTNPIAQTCQSNPLEPGVIEPVPLEGELGYIKNEVEPGKIRVSVGMDFKPTPPNTHFTAYTCGATAEGATIEGSVIAKYKEIDKMTRVADLFFTASGSQQIPEAFQEGAADTLSTSYTPGLVTAPTGLKARVLGASNSPVTTEQEYEIKAIER